MSEETNFEARKGASFGAFGISLMLHAAALGCAAVVWPLRHELARPAYIMVGYFGSAAGAGAGSEGQPKPKDSVTEVSKAVAPKTVEYVARKRVQADVRNRVGAAVHSRLRAEQEINDGSSVDGIGHSEGFPGNADGASGGGGSGGHGVGGSGSGGDGLIPVQYGNNPPPEYPAEARLRNEHGTVTLKVLVAANGAVERVEMLKSSGAEELDDAAIETVKGKWRFVPARRGGLAMESWVVVPIRFDLRQAKPGDSGD